MDGEVRLIARIADGDEDAFAELHAAYYPRLVRFLSRMTDDEALVAELTNDVFVVVWRRAGTFRAASQVSSWILGIAYRKALKALSRRRVFEPLAEDAVVSDGPEAMATPDLDLSRLLRHLTPEQRAVLVLTYRFGYSYREIAEILNCPENTVKTRMFKARRTLSAHVGESWL